MFHRCSRPRMAHQVERDSSNRLRSGARRLEDSRRTALEVRGWQCTRELHWDRFSMILDTYFYVFCMYLHMLLFQKWCFTCMRTELGRVAARQRPLGWTSCQSSTTKEIRWSAARNGNVEWTCVQSKILSQRLSINASMTFHDVMKLHPDLGVHVPRHSLRLMQR